MTRKRTGAGDKSPNGRATLPPEPQAPDLAAGDEYPGNGIVAHSPGGGSEQKTPETRLELTRLDGIKPEPVRWLVRGRVPLGKLALVAGDGGYGKTTLTLGMAADLSKGRACCGLDYRP